MEQGQANRPLSRSLFVRSLVLGMAVFLALAAWMLGPDLFKLGWKALPIEFRVRVPFLYLDALLIAYPVALLVAVGLISAVLIKGDRSRHADPARRRRQVRSLALGTSILLSLLLLDIGAVAWRSWRDRMPRLPGVLPTALRKGVNGVEGSTEIPPPDASPTLPSRFAAGGGTENALRILVIGESSAEGQPYNPWLSVGQIAAWKLESVFPGRPVKVNMWAYGGATLWDMHNRLAGLNYRPDALLLYVGHNEFQARFAWQREPGNYYLDERPKLYSPESLTSLLRFSPLCRLALDTWEHHRVSIRPPRRATRNLIDQPTCSPEEYAAIRDDFARRLEAIADYCDEIKTQAIFIVPPSNDGGYDPNRSALDPATPRSEREAFAREVERTAPWNRPISPGPCGSTASWWRGTPSSPRVITASPVFWSRPASGARPASTTSWPASTTACRSDARKTSGAPIAKWPLDTRRSCWSTGPRCSRRPASTASPTTDCSPTPITRTSWAMSRCLRTC